MPPKLEAPKKPAVPKKKPKKKKKAAVEEQQKDSDVNILLLNMIYNLIIKDLHLFPVTFKDVCSKRFTMLSQVLILFLNFTNDMYSLVKKIQK